MKVSGSVQSCCTPFRSGLFPDSCGKSPTPAASAGQSWTVLLAIPSSVACSPATFGRMAVWRSWNCRVKSRAWFRTCSEIKPNSCRWILQDFYLRPSGAFSVWLLCQRGADESFIDCLGFECGFENSEGFENFPVEKSANAFQKVSCCQNKGTDQQILTRKYGQYEVEKLN